VDGMLSPVRRRTPERLALGTHENRRGLTVRDVAQESSEELNLLVEPGPPQDLGRNRRTTVHPSVESLLLDGPGGRLIQTARRRHGVYYGRAGEDGGQRQGADEQGTVE